MTTPGPYRIPNNRPYQLAFRLWQLAGTTSLPIVLQSAQGFILAPGASSEVPPLDIPTTISWNVATLQFTPALVGALATGLWDGAAQLIDQTGVGYEVDFSAILFAGISPPFGAIPAPGVTADVTLAYGAIDVITLGVGPPGTSSPVTAAGLALSPAAQTDLGDAGITAANVEAAIVSLAQMIMAAAPSGSDGGGVGVTNNLSTDGLENH